MMLPLPIFAYVIAAAVLMASGFGAGWKVQGNIAEAKISRLTVAAAKKEADAKDAMVKASEAARIAEQALNTKYQGALDEAAKREIALRRSLDASRATERGLRDSIYSIRRDLPGYSPSAAVATADTATDLLGQCAAEVVRLGEAADRHADDAMMLREAWPTSTSRQSP